MAPGRKPWEERFLHKNTNKKLSQGLCLLQGNAPHCHNCFFWTWPPRGSNDVLQEKCQLQYSQCNKNNFFFFFLTISFSGDARRVLLSLMVYSPCSNRRSATVQGIKAISNPPKSIKVKKPAPSSLPCGVHTCCSLLPYIS